MSTIQVDRIIPYQSSSVTIEGDVTVFGAATTGSNTFTGDQNIQGTLTASIQEGYVLAGGAGDVSVLVATSSFGSVIDTSSLATTGSNTFVGNQIVTGTDKQTFSDPGNNQEVRTISVNSFVDSQGYTMGINTFGWYHFDGEGHQGFSSNLFTNDYAYGGSWFHDPNKFEYILFPSGSPYDSNLFGLYDNGDTTTKFRVVTDKIEFTGSVNTTTDVTVGGNLNVTAGNINARDIIMDDPGANSTILMNPAFFSEFVGTNLQWREGDNQMNLTMGEDSVEVLLNGWDTTTFTYDNALYFNVNSDGASFSDWDGSYTRTPWLNVPKQGSINFKRALKLEALDPLPAGALGELAVSGSNLYFHNGSTWSQII